ncbi:unnamed protein product [Microthlaspi erraticum]|uniref:Uncharacterized protein n=1 Tax=Microthlaspi erraticum TaxID=1685480 RepID=A0A6D2HAE1_9BRAS|nr:unnamed protein product [Microthlaspi erraticum]
MSIALGKISIVFFLVLLLLGASEARNLVVLQPFPVAAVAVAVEKTPVFKTWQHPAAPFCYEPSSMFVPPFVPV